MNTGAIYGAIAVLILFLFIIIFIKWKSNRNAIVIKDIKYPNEDAKEINKEETGGLRRGLRGRGGERESSGHEEFNKRNYQREPTSRNPFDCLRSDEQQYNRDKEGARTDKPFIEKDWEDFD